MQRYCTTVHKGDIVVNRLRDAHNGTPANNETSSELLQWEQRYFRPTQNTQECCRQQNAQLCPSQQL